MNDTDYAVHGRIREWAFHPAFGLGNAHLQTVCGGLWPVRPRLRIRRERWELPDGDFVDIDWLGTDTDAPWALVLPGLVGSLASPYAVRLLKRLAAAGYRAGLLNYRGLSGAPNRLVTAYHAGFTDDLNLIATRLAEHFAPGFVIGYSMGGNLLLKWLGEAGTAAPVAAAAAVSTPFRLAPAADGLCEGKARYYGRYLTGYMRRFARRKFARLAPPFPLPVFAELKNLRDFDERITAPLHGFAGAEDYYERASCFPWLAQITVPTLIVNALDDPLIPRSCLPAAGDLSPSITLELAEHGGHVGFLGRNRYGFPRFVIADRLLAFSSQHSD
ncbi:MAG: YheT family hydrolase [Gammaproteobacteria bacterium]